MTYHHTQYGALMPILLAALAIPALWVAFADPGPSAQWPLLAAAIMIVVLAWLFASLTVEVSEREIQWYFGPGLWTYRIARAELDGVAVVRNTWWDGFGIRVRPGFRLYNVSGLDAVELRLKSGDVRRIGTDDAQGLAAALRA